MKRITALLLSALMLLPLLGGCAADTPASDTDAADTTVADTTAAGDTEETTTDRSQVKDNLPENLNYDGEKINIACRGSSLFTWELVSEDNGDVVDSAIHERNAVVSERLGVELNVIPGDSNQSNYMDNVRSTILSQSPDYDVVAGAQYKAAQMVLQNCFRNVAEEEYLDFAQPWWDSEYMANLTIDPAQMYMLAGDLTLTKIEWTAAMYFNKALYRDRFGDPDEFYKTVLDGGWTLDMLYSLAADVYTDANGDGVKDAGDTLGMFLTANDQMDRITFAMGVRYSERDENGFPTLVFNNERTVRFVEEIYRFFFENPGVTYTEKAPDPFLDGHALFTTGSLFTAKSFRDTGVEYGILPWPKLDAEQENYYSGVQDNIALYMLPTTLDDERADMTCAVLEAMCAENYRNVIRAYYEATLKFQYSDGELYTRVVDLIHDTATTDIVYVYSYALNNVGTLLRGVVKNSNANFSSMYKKLDAPIHAALDKLIGYFTEE